MAFLEAKPEDTVDTIHDAIRGIVQQMQDVGLEASCEVNEYDSAVEVRILLPKDRFIRKEMSSIDSTASRSILSIFFLKRIFSLRVRK